MDKRKLSYYSYLEKQYNVSRKASHECNRKKTKAFKNMYNSFILWKYKTRYQTVVPQPLKYNDTLYLSTYIKTAFSLSTIFPAYTNANYIITVSSRGHAKRHNPVKNNSYL